MAARKDKLLNLKCCCPEQWGKFSPHKSHSSWLLSKLAPWNRQSSVMTKESCCTTMKYPVNAEQGIQIHCQEKFSLFLLDQKQSHHINQAVFLQAHRPSHCSNGRHYTSRHLKKAIPVICAVTWLFSNIYGSWLHYAIREKKKVQ